MASVDVTDARNDSVRGPTHRASHARREVKHRDVAHEACVHPIYLARIFRRRHRCSASEHLRTLRLIEAAHLVMQGAPLAHAEETVTLAGTLLFLKSSFRRHTDGKSQCNFESHSRIIDR
jgi:AraC-like DNA-binding protein